jgi:chromatin segregation and condensation protein Rec8/ScpA/Scc1 (kleisin family)
MDWLQFISSIVQSLVSLAWPAALVVAVWLFREKLTELLPQLRAKYKDVEISFKLDQAEKEAARLPAPEKPSEATPEEETRFEQLASVSPRAAIQEMRRELEYAVSNVAVQHGLAVQPQSLLMATRALRNKGIIGQDFPHCWMICAPLEIRLRMAARK